MPNDKSFVYQNYYMPEEEEEKSHIITYKDGKYDSKSLVNFDFKSLWDNYENKILLSELYHQSLTENQLHNIFAQKMHEYFQYVADTQHKSIREVFSENYNPGSEEGLLHMRELLRVLLTYDFVDRDINNIYSLNLYTGKPNVEEFLAKKHQDKWMFFKMLDRNRYKPLNLIQMTMKWIEIKYTNQIDQLLYLFNPNHPPLNFLEILQKYIEYLRTIEKEDIKGYDPDYIKNDISERLNSLIEAGLLKQIKEDNQYKNCIVLTEKGFSYVNMINKELKNIISDLSEDHIIEEDDDEMKLTNNGEIIAQTSLNNIYNDSDRLLEPPKYNINNRDRHQIGKNAPLYLQVRKNKEEELNQQVININRSEIDGWRQYFVKATSTRFNMLNILMFVSFIVAAIGMITLKLINNNDGLYLLYAGSIGAGLMMLLLYLRNKWKKEEYYTAQMEKKKIREQKVENFIKRIRRT